MAITANRIRYRVCRKTLKICLMFIFSRRPATSAAKKQPVPVADSQLKSYLAFSGVGFDTTGAARVTCLCKYGTSQPPFLKFGVVATFIAFLIDGSPQAMTNTDRIANGIHAFRICPRV